MAACIHMTSCLNHYFKKKDITKLFTVENGYNQTQSSVSYKLLKNNINTILAIILTTYLQKSTKKPLDFCEISTSLSIRMLLMLNQAYLTSRFAI